MISFQTCNKKGTQQIYYCLRALCCVSHQRVEQIAGKDDEEGDGGEEDEYQPPGHHLFKQSGLGQGQADDRHHKGDGCDISSKRAGTYRREQTEDKRGEHGDVAAFKP